MILCRIRVVMIALLLSSGIASARDHAYLVGQVVRNADVEAESTLFNPEGYFFPSDTVDIRGYRLDSISLRVLDAAYGGRFHADSSVYRPWAMLLLLKAGEEDTTGHEDNTSGYEASAATISADSLDLVFPDTPIGEVRVTGAFVDKRGHYWEHGEVDYMQATVLGARVQVLAKGKLAYSRVVGFKYWEGD